MQQRMVCSRVPHRIEAEDKVFNFIKGLNSYKLVKAKPKDLVAAMTFIDSLVDLNLGDRSLSKNAESSKKVDI